MTVSSELNKESYAGDGITTNFPAPFYFQNASDLVVQTFNTTTFARTTLVLNTDYTISAATDANFGWPTGGTVITSVAPVAGTNLEIYRAVAPLQPLAIPQSGPFPSQPIERQLDKLAMAIQDATETLSEQAVLLPLDQAGTFNNTLPEAIGQASSQGCVIIVNPTNNGFAIGPNTSEIANAESYAVAAAASAASASTSAATATSEAAAAAASAAAASAAADSVTWANIEFVNHTNSPVNISSGNNSTMYVADCSAGQVVFNLPQLSTLTIPPPFNLGIKKTDSSSNTVLINAHSGDTIDGNASATLASQNQSVTLSADKTANEWISQGFGLITAGGVQATAGTVLTGTTVQAQLNEADALFHGGINTANLANGAVTPAKLGTANIVQSASTASFSTNSNSFVTVVSVSITTSGRPVLLKLQPDGGSSPEQFGIESGGSTPSNIDAVLKFLRGATAIFEDSLSFAPPVANALYDIPSSGYNFIDTPSAGTYTYTLQARVVDTTTTFLAYNCKLVAMEI